MRRRTDKPCKPRGVSLPLDVNEKVDARLKQLKPRVKGFSHYVQLLVDWDLKRDKRKEEISLPFDLPDCQLSGFAN